MAIRPISDITTPPYYPGQIIDTQTKKGANSALANISSASVFTTNAALNDIVRLSYTPPVNCWWEVAGWVGLMSKTDAAYHWGEIHLVMSVADVDGAADTIGYEVQHLTVNYYFTYAPRRIWKLAAGVAYTCTLTFHSSGGTWQYYQGPDHLWIEGKAWVR